MKRIKKIDKTLQWIKDSSTGRRFTEIQNFIAQLSGLEKSPSKGYHCTNLLGQDFPGRATGYLRRYCRKENGRWVYAGGRLSVA
jgi:hypothetical protein